MSVNNMDDYRVFAGVMAGLSAEDRKDATKIIGPCMKASGGRMDPGMISEWVRMWDIVVDEQLDRFWQLTESGVHKV